MATISDKRIIEAIDKFGGRVSLAAKELGVTRDMIYKRSKRSQEIHDAIHESRTKFQEELNDIARSKLLAALMRGESWAIKFQLERRDKEYLDVKRTEITGADGEELTWEKVFKANAGEI